MKNIVKHSLEKFFSLPSHFITEEADLYILAILSLYFKGGQATRDGITNSEIDPVKLMLSRDDLKIEGKGRKIKIHLKELLQQDLPTALKKKAHFQDEVGNDGFSSHMLEVVLCILEISKQFNCDFMEFPEEEKVKTSVNEFLEFVVQNSSKLTKNKNYMLL